MQQFLSDNKRVYFPLLISYNVLLQKSSRLHLLLFKTLTFHKVVQLHTWGVMESLVTVLLHMFSWFRKWNKFENRSIFDQVKAYKKVCQFLGPTCSWRFNERWGKGGFRNLRKGAGPFPSPFSLLPLEVGFLNQLRSLRERGPKRTLAENEFGALESCQKATSGNHFEYSEYSVLRVWR